MRVGGEEGVEEVGGQLFRVLLLERTMPGLVTVRLLV